MARNGWENMDVMSGSHGAARPGVGFWGWMLRLCVVAGLTLAGAFYVPLYRAHKELTAEYESLNQRAESIGQELGVMRTELAATKAKRDELEARRGMDQTRERASRELVEQTKTDLDSKLARFVGKGTLAVAVRQNRVVVHFPAAITETAAHTDVGVETRIALCALSAAVIARGPTDVSVVSRDDASAAEPGKSRAPWEGAAERSALLARVLVEKCKYPIEHVEAVARPAVGGDHAANPADLRGAADVEIDPGSGAFTAL